MNLRAPPCQVIQLAAGLAPEPSSEKLIVTRCPLWPQLTERDTAFEQCTANWRKLHRNAETETVILCKLCIDEGTYPNVREAFCRHNTRAGKSWQSRGRRKRATVYVWRANQLAGLCTCAMTRLRPDRTRPLTSTPLGNCLPLPCCCHLSRRSTSRLGFRANQDQECPTIALGYT